ncbi:STAS domain-containing protein [Streptomyces sp. NPDC006553]|uniref:STAS domain-containing protein n=1 Tax=unclassified Streptomyces TaxID=2593676 RepID=UPI00224DAB6A|nr:STAS domain-containing protein [Streptomyces sp. NBC_00233]MCX5231909.1 STAS domain-containing protein [Streptomyces sp. NBC_00233]
MHPLPDRSTDLPAPAGDTGTEPPSTRPDTQMTVKVTPDGTVVVRGEIDSATAPQLRRSLLDALHAHPEGVTLDLAAVTFCDCAGLRAFLTARAAWGAPHQRLDSGRVPVALGAVSPRMTRLLQLTGAGELLAPPKTGLPQ